MEKIEIRECASPADEELLLGPEENIPVLVERAAEADEIMSLETGFLIEIGEEPLKEEGVERLKAAVEEGDIVFFIAKRLKRPVGMCSVARSFSTFACSYVAVFEDFYVEPAFRKSGIARRLASAAQAWCKENGVASITVTCAPCDEGMYRALGFTEPLGRTLAKLL